MRIAIFTDTFYPQVNGVVTATINIAKGLAEKGHEIHIIAPKEMGIKEFKFDGVKVRRVYGIPAMFYTGYKFTPPVTLPLINYIVENNIELIHFQTPFSLGMNAILLSKLLNLPLIGTFHTFVAHPEYRKHVKLDYKFMDKVSWSYIRSYYNRCDLITSPSNETKKELIREEFNTPIKVISNGIDLNMFDSSHAGQIRKKYGENSKLILFVGRIAYEKNIFFLVDSFEKVSKKIPDARLLIIGDGPQMNELKEEIQSKNLSDKILLLGEVKHDKLIKSSIFNACDLFVTASVTENQPMTVLEAQANGLPCIGLDSGGMKDLIKNNYNGYLLNPKDKNGFSKAIVELLLNKNLLKKMIKNTLKMIKKHALPQVIDQWEITYQKTIDNQRIQDSRKKDMLGKELQGILEQIKKTK